jgi:lipopolysaccharide transport system ATP-binding protein
MYYVDLAIASLNPFTVQIYERNIIAFHVNDRAGDDTARGDWTGELAGVIRPLLEWNTEFISE